MDCREARELTSASIDAALTPEEQEVVEQHVRGCESCSRFLALELKTKHLLRQRLPQPPVPAGLREKIIQALEGTETREMRRKQRIASWLLKPIPLLATAGVVALLLAVTIFHAGPRSTEASPFVRDSVDGHVKCLLGEYLMEARLGGIDDLSRWFQERLKSAVHLPRFAHQDQTELWEGRISLMGGVRSAQLFYRWRGKTLSLFVLPGETMNLMPGEERVWGGRTFYVSHHRGHTSLMWRDGDLAYCLVSELSPEEVMAFASQQEA